VDSLQNVLYFHPSWVSDIQKVFLSGQLMGISSFVSECFEKPKLISLQNGKFIIMKFDRFMLVSCTHLKGFTLKSIILFS
jgi:hypothetical protein